MFPIEPFMVQPCLLVASLACPILPTSHTGLISDFQICMIFLSQIDEIISPSTRNALPLALLIGHFYSFIKSQIKW